MPTIAHLIEKIIQEKPFLQEGLARGIINNAALAEELQPEIEKELGKKIKFGAVNMGIRRLSEKLEKTFVSKAKFDKNTDVTIKSNLIEITLFKVEKLQEKLKKIYNIVNLKEGDFLTITQGVHEVMIIVNEKYEKKILDIFPKKNIKKIIRDLNSLIINIPIGSIETVGLFYIVTRALNWENINIIDIVSTLTEMTFIIKEKDTPNAFKALRKLIRDNR